MPIESITAQQRLNSPDDVEAYESYFKQLREAAVTGNELETLLLRVSATLGSEDATSK